MEKSKKNLIVTLANENFINQAKQLFSSIYYNANWQGDYLLLAHNISDKDLAWFKEKGIKVYKTEIISEHTGPGNYPGVVLSKLYLFKEYFKKWQKIIFIDADCIVNATLNDLLTANEFSAPQAERIKLKNEFSLNKSQLKELKKKYKVHSPCFNTGIFVFNSQIIQADTFKELKSLFFKYQNNSLFGEEPILNLYFYKNWKPLSDLYNFNPFHYESFYKIKEEKVKTIISHFYTINKPWLKTSPHYSLWQCNLKKADSIDLQVRKVIGRNISKSEQEKSLGYIKFKKRRYQIKQILLFLPLLIDRLIGKIGLMIKIISPSLYDHVSLKKDVK